MLTKGWLKFYCLALPSILINHLLLTSAMAEDRPELMLANPYHPDIAIKEFWISEKLDGIRAHWDGNQFVSRGGKIFAAPFWFTERFPAVAMDGELWIARGQYERTSSIVRKKLPHEGWKEIYFMIFDLPDHRGIFSERIASMQRLMDQNESPYLVMIQQSRITNKTDLMRHLTMITDNGGEGLMLHRQSAYYFEGRSKDLLKLKIFHDAEATVIGYREGKGQFKGMLGSLRVRTDEGLVFYVGSGLNLEQRVHPPSIASRITFRHQGYTKKGIPRFPVFLRIRDEEPEK